MENSGQKIKRHKISRMEVLHRAENSKYIGGCEADLLKLANDTLHEKFPNTELYLVRIFLYLD